MVVVRRQNMNPLSIDLTREGGDLSDFEPPEANKSYALTSSTLQRLMFNIIIIIFIIINIIRYRSFVDNIVGYASSIIM